MAVAEMYLSQNVTQLAQKPSVEVHENYCYTVTPKYRSLTKKGLVRGREERDLKKQKKDNPKNNPNQNNAMAKG